MLDDAAIGGQEVLFSIIDEGEYAAEIKTFNDLMKISGEIFNRQCYPYTPSYFMRGYRQYIAKVFVVLLKPREKLWSQKVLVYRLFWNYFQL